MAQLSVPTDSPVFADEFDDGVVSGWTSVVPAGSLTLTEDLGLLSMLVSGAAASDCSAIVRALPAFTTSLTVEVCARTIGLDGNYLMFGPVFSRGVVDTDAVIWQMNYNWGRSGFAQRDIRSGTFTNAPTDHNAPGSSLGMTGPLLFLRFRYDVTNGFRQWHSADRVSWLDGGSWVANPMGGAPTHFGVGISNWGDANPRIGTLEYVRAYADL